MMASASVTTMSLVDLLPEFSDKQALHSIAVFGLSIDSRNITENYIFVATAGVHVHGEKFIADAVANGASAILVNAGTSEYALDEKKTAVYQVPVLQIPYLNDRLSEIAGRFLNHPTKIIPLIGITGTNGKTTCAQIFAQLSALNQQKSGVVGTVGYGVCSAANDDDDCVELPLVSTGMTTPDAVSTQYICSDLIQQHASNIVMEVSSHGLAQGRVAALAFDIAVFTNLSHDHLDYHGDMQAYGQAKALLFAMPSLSKVVLNIDDPFSLRLAENIASGVRVITYSLQDSSADIFLSDIVQSSQYTEAVVHIDRMAYPICTSLLGQFNLSNLLAVLGIVYQSSELLHIDIPQAIARIPLLKSVSGRMESIVNDLGIRVVVDYAHTPDALDNALNTLSMLQSSASDSQGRIICVLGCGGDRDQDKRPLMARIAQTYADIVVVTNDNPRTEDPQKIVNDMMVGFSEGDVQVVLDRELAIKKAVQQSRKGDIVLIAGKGHEDYQLIGDKKYSFSDQTVAREALREKGVAA